MRNALLISIAVKLLTSCTITEPLLYQGTTEGSTPPAPVYVYQRRGEEPRFNFIGTTRRITLTDYETRVIDVVTQQNIHTFLHPPGGSESFSETDSAGRVFVQADKHRADVLDMVTGKPVQSFKPVSSSSSYTNLSPDGKMLFFDSRLWDVATAKQIIELNDDPVQNSAVFSADGRYFALGALSGIQWLDLQTKQIERLPAERKISQLLFGRDKRLYRSYGTIIDSFWKGDDGYWMDELAVSQLGDNKTRITFGPRSRIACWVLSPNHQVFAALLDGTLIWLNEDLKIQKQWHSELNVTACLPDTHNRIWLGTEKNGLLRLNPEQGLLKQVLPPTIYWIQSVKLSADENYLGMLLFRSDDPSRKVEIYKTADLQ